MTRLIEYWDYSFVLFFMARSAAEATNLSTKKRKRIESAVDVVSRLSARRVSQRRTNASPASEKIVGIIDNAGAFKTDTQQRFASGFKTEEQKHSKTARIERNNARKFQSFHRRFQSCSNVADFSKHINDHKLHQLHRNRDILSLKNKIFNDAIKRAQKRW